MSNQPTDQDYQDAFETYSLISQDWGVAPTRYDPNSTLVGTRVVKGHTVELHSLSKLFERDSAQFSAKCTEEKSIKNLLAAVPHNDLEILTQRRSNQNSNFIL